MTPRSKGRVTTCTRDEARTRLNQARAFLDVAKIVLSDDQHEAHVAAALAVLAGIAASDAICGLRLGQWSRGSDHAMAVELLATVAVKDPTVIQAQEPAEQQGRGPLLATPDHGRAREGHGS